MKKRLRDAAVRSLQHLLLRLKHDYRRTSCVLGNSRLQRSPDKSTRYDHLEGILVSVETGENHCKQTCEASADDGGLKSFAETRKDLYEKPGHIPRRSEYNCQVGGRNERSRQVAECGL